ncbi:integrating conjugative element protein, PFL_4709 family [Pasteurella testudinis DSM 23072]|uniref:Integrating conjugative element protein, PFL_4709 family n=1 Tax=Pasteurella testudinis DSM 23072 TaxID=1122938 RepID=A0A1W1UW77_9PAST|nr:TIGR03757 family integrating conjugative element protein [Pasteurella testudinis]SMB85249.1 integrating conjugative element protein, PFL_4709 family [Pasteurella testudinis DSM 23072]SUB52144.1 integrating conjugative element protein, PFL family [Pasteurella testudinis]
MRKKQCVGIGITLLFQPMMIWAETVPNPTITIYTTAAYPIKNMTDPDLATIYYLDGAEQIEDRFSTHFSEQPEQAEQQAQALFNSQEWKQYEKQLQAAYAGVISGWQNGIKKVPAILFDYPGAESVVTYGITDLALARQHWLNWLQQQQMEGIR